MSQLVLAHGIGVIDLVSEDEEGHLGQLLHGEEGVELGLGLGEALVVLGVDEEDDPADFGEVVFPQAACYTPIKCQLASSISQLPAPNLLNSTHPAGDRPDRTL
jgi:hypothetical protein